MAKQPARTFRDLGVWQKSHALVLEVYKLTRQLPKEEVFGLVSQMRRASVSVPANIAGAIKRRGKADKARQLNIAQGSLEDSGISSSCAPTWRICRRKRSAIVWTKWPVCSVRIRRRFRILAPDSGFDSVFRILSSDF